MLSRTKPELSKSEIQNIFSEACLGTVKSAKKLGDGEYNAVYDVITDMGNYVLKVSPLDKTKVLTYEQDMMRGEVFWYAQLRTHTNIKVPYVYYKDFSHKIYPADFFIMEKMKGEQLNNAKLSPDEKLWCRQEIGKMTAYMHKITNNQYGYLQNKLHDNWYLAYKSMVSNLIADAERANRKSRNGRKLLKYADKYKDVLEKVPCVMVNFDLWYGNILCVRNNSSIELILIDPERTLWGDPIMDFANLEFEKMLNRKTVSIDSYNSVSKAKIKCTRDEMIRFAFGIGYLGLVMEVEKYYRYSPRYFGWWRNIASSRLLYTNAFKILNE